MQSTFLYFSFFFSLLSISTFPHHLLASTIKPNETDFHALLAFKAEISDDPNSVLASWNKSFHFCLWEGILCGRKHKRVVTLDLSSSKLVGTLSPFIGNLSFLHKLALNNNSFRGEIPHQLSHLFRLRTLALSRNSFEGEIPTNLSRCLHLTTLHLSHNNLAGKFPYEISTLPNLENLILGFNELNGQLQAIGIGNMSTSLQTLYLSQNHLQGHIPDDIGRLENLVDLRLGENMLSGTIPSSLFNLSRLNYLHLRDTNIHGHLPQDLGLRLSLLRHLDIANSSLVGQVPITLSNLSKIEDLDISINSFMGKFYINGNNLPRLSFLNIGYIFPLEGEARGLSFLDTLTNCSNLKFLLLGGNSFTGILPHSILNLSSSLLALVLERNRISGQLPSGLGKFVNLYVLDLQDNQFTGQIPADIGEVKSMEGLIISYNNFSGEIPSSLGNLSQLNLLYMGYNDLEGSIPKNLGNCRNLQKLYLNSNKLSGVLPVELFHASNLNGLAIGQNNLHGLLSEEISRLKMLFWLDVSHNRFSGEIPSTLGGCTSLDVLNMSMNSFLGSIPKSFSTLRSIEMLDLSYNLLSGKIPTYFSNWTYLLSLNLSFNSLEGEVPVDGVFANTSVVSVVGNKKLCGGVFRLHLPSCPQHREPKRRLSLAITMTISIACVLLVVLSFALCFYFRCSSRKIKNTPSKLQNIKPLLEVSYQMLSRATNGFSPSNLIGVGGFASVYKGLLHQDGKETMVAVKVLNLHNKGAGKSFIAECNALRNIRHRNLVKIITACSSIDTQRNDFKALVYEFMPKGSLESWLHNESCSLSLFQRLSIAVDIASALEYLHIGCATSIIHCDLKPSNILLDDEMTAHVGDFGLAKFLSFSATNRTSTTQVRGTVGYTAPEYGLGSKESPEGDMYSFGIIVLEMMTSKKPTDSVFNDDLNLHDFAKAALSDGLMVIIDQRMLDDSIQLPRKTLVSIKMECIKSLIMIGVRCSLDPPQERMGINDVVNELKCARRNLLGRRTK